MARRAGLAVRADRLRRGLIRRRRRQPQNIRSSRAASKRTTTLPAGDRTYLVLAKPNVIMNVEGDGLGALNRLHGDQCSDHPPTIWAVWHVFGTLRNHRPENGF